MTIKEMYFLLLYDNIVSYLVKMYISVTIYFTI